jgi:YbbR domain-containing protein
MNKIINKKILILISVLLFLPLFVGCFSAPPTNQSPTITSTPITIATVDVLYTYDVNATGPDGDTLTYSLTTSPTGMTIDSTTGVISWTPNSGQIGDHNVTVKVSDGNCLIHNLL